MQLQQFDGGLSIRKRPQFIQVNEGEVYHNIDNEKGTLLPVKAKTLVAGLNLAKYNFFYESKSQWVSSSAEASWIEYKSVLYRANGVAPTKFDGSNEYALGITQPSTAPVTAKVVVAEPMADVTISVTTSGGLTNKIENYLLINSDSTFYANPLSFTVDEEGEALNINVINNVPTSGLFAASRTTTSVDTRDITISNVIGATYGSAGVDVYRAYGGKYYLVGNLASAAATLIDNTEDISGNTLLDAALFAKLEGTYQYVLTFLNSNDGTESGPSAYSTELTVAGPIQVSSLAVSSDAQVDKKKLYRLGGNSTILTLVTTLDNVTTSFEDTIVDSDLLADVLETTISNPAPLELRHLREAYAMLWGVVGTKVYYTPIDQPNSWPELYYIDYVDTVTGIAPVSNGILVMTKYKTHLITGTGPNSLATQLLRSDQGCLANNSVQLFQGAALWASTDGICVSNGNDVILLTKDKLGKYVLTPVNSCLHDEVYYVVNADATILAVDMRYGTMFRTLDLGVETLTVANDILYGWNSTGMYTIFSSANYETFQFKSTRFTEGIVSKAKSFKKFHLYSKGVIIIKVIAEDGQILANKEFATTGKHELQVPSSMQRQEFIQLDISGTGEVYEIRFQAEALNND